MDRRTVGERMTRAYERARTFLYTDLWKGLPAPRSRRWLYQVLRMGVLTWEGLVKADVFTLAAALTFKVVFSLVPFLAVILAFFKGFGGLSDLAREVKLFVLQNVTGNLGEQIIGQLDQFVDNVSAAAIGVAGFAILLYMSLSLLDTVEKAFNKIWGIQNPRALLRRFTVYWTILTVSPIVLAGIVTMKTFVQSNRVYQWMTSHVPFFGPMALGVAPFIFAWILFSVVYVILPNTRVRLSAALVGAIVAGTAWNLMATIYVWYNARVVTNYKFYGGLGSIPIFLLWIYLSWVVVLFGAEIAFAVQHVETYKRQLENVKLSAADRDRLALILMLEAVRTFEAGGAPPTAEGLAAKLDAPARVLHEVVYLLMDKGILREVSGVDAKDPGLVPGRDPSVMTVRDVLQAVRTHGDPFGLPESIGAREAYRLINEAEERATAELARVTLKDLAARTSSPPTA